MNKYETAIPRVTSGVAIDAQMLRAGVNLDQLATRAHATVHELKRAFETGDCSFLSVGTLRKVEEILGVDLYEPGPANPAVQEMQIGARIAMRQTGASLDELVAEFQISPDEVEDVIRNLRRAASAAGMTILRSNGRYRIAPGMDVAAEVARLDRWTLTDITDAELSIVLDIWVGQTQDRLRTTRDFVAADQETVVGLVDRGIVVPAGDELRLANLILDSLQPLQVVSIPYREYRKCRSPK